MAYNRHFTQYINIAYIIQNTIKVWLRNQNKERQPQMLDPRSSQLGSTTDQPEKTNNNDQSSSSSHLSLIASPALVSSAPATVWKYLWVMRTQQSHTREIKTI